MVPFNVLEQVNSKTLALIRANGRQHGRPGTFEIPRNLMRIESPQSYVGVISVDDQRLAGSGHAERGGQAMRLARQCSQRLRGFSEIRRFMEDASLERERLIGADAIGVGTH